MFIEGTGDLVVLVESAYSIRRRYLLLVPIAREDVYHVEYLYIDVIIGEL